MAWLTTEDGRRVNTDWFSEDERRKYRQIEENQKQANERNIKLPAHIKFEKWTGGWMIVDAKKERFEDGWDSGVNISKVSRVYTTSSSGSGHSSTEYKISYKGQPIKDTIFASLKEAKEYIKKLSGGI